MSKENYISRYFGAVIIVITLACLALSSCWKEKSLTYVNELPSADVKSLPLNHAYDIEIPTYEGSYHSVHPDLCVRKVNGEVKDFVLAYTPYPRSNDSFENPSIVKSYNGLKFSELAAGVNPISPKPLGGYNNDPDLIYNEDTNEYYMYYLETCRPDSQNVILLTSSNKLSWTKQTIIHYSLINHERFIVSPTVIRDASGMWYMFYVNAIRVTSSNPIEYLTSNDGIHWDKNDINAALATRAINFTPWHADVFQYGAWYYMLVCGTLDNPNLYLARSRDLHSWEYCDDPVLTPQSSGLDVARIYRSTGAVIDGALIIYFSYRHPNREWNIGVYKTLLDLYSFE